MTDKDNITGVIERLNIIFANSQLSIQDFSDRIKIDRGQFGKVLNGKMGITLKQLMEISSQFGIRIGWIIEGEEPIYKNEKSGPIEPDFLPIIRKQLSTAFFSLQEAMKTLPQPLGPEKAFEGDPAFRQSGKKNKTDKP